MPTRQSSSPRVTFPTQCSRLASAHWLPTPVPARGPRPPLAPASHGIAHRPPLPSLPLARQHLADLRPVPVPGEHRCSQLSLLLSVALVGIPQPLPRWWHSTPPGDISRERRLVYRCRGDPRPPQGPAGPPPAGHTAQRPSPQHGFDRARLQPAEAPVQRCHGRVQYPWHPQRLDHRGRLQSPPLPDRRVKSGTTDQAAVARARVAARGWRRPWVRRGPGSYAKVAQSRRPRAGVSIPKAYPRMHHNEDLGGTTLALT
jgi:hypothetical protein